MRVHGAGTWSSTPCAVCERLDEGLVKLLGAAGPQVVDAPMICMAADVPFAEFGEHFASARDCVVDAYDRELARVMVRLERALRGPGWWEVRLERGIEALVDHYSARPGAGTLVLVTGPETCDAGLLARRDLARQRLVALLAGEGDEAEVPTLHYELLVGALFCCLRDRALSPGGFDDVRGDLVSELCGRMSVLAPIAA